VRFLLIRCQKYTPTDCFFDDFAHRNSHTNSQRNNNFQKVNQSWFCTTQRYEITFFSFMLSMVAPSAGIEAIRTTLWNKQT